MTTTITSKPTATPHARQRGAALITGLLIMLVMTLIGIAAMESSVIQTNLASNAQFKAITYQEAEAALMRYTHLDSFQEAMDGDIDRDYKDSLSLEKGTTTANAITANATVSYCGSMPPEQIRGLGLDANQAANSGSYTRYVFDVTATADLSDVQATSRHTQVSSRLMLTSPGGAGLVCRRPVPRV